MDEHERTLLRTSDVTLASAMWRQRQVGSRVQRVQSGNLLNPTCCDLGWRATGSSRARVRVASRSNRSGPGIVRHRVVIRLVGRSDSPRKTNARLNFDRAPVGGIWKPPRSLCVRFSETRSVSVCAKPGAPAPVGAASCTTPQCDEKPFRKPTPTFFLSFLCALGPRFLNGPTCVCWMPSPGPSGSGQCDQKSFRKPTARVTFFFSLRL